MLELNVSQAGVARVAVAGRSSLRMREISSLLTRLPSGWLLPTAVNTSAKSCVGRATGRDVELDKVLVVVSGHQSDGEETQRESGPHLLGGLPQSHQAA